MSKTRGVFETFAIGLLTGVGTAAILALQLMSKQPDGCEPVVDVQYKKVGRDSFPHTVIRRPVRDGDRCVLAEVGV